MGTLFTMKGVSATGSEDFRNLPEFEFANGKMFDRETIATVNYASSTINNQSNVCLLYTSYSRRITHQN